MWNNMKVFIIGYVYLDEVICWVVKEVYDWYYYVIDFYGVVGYLALQVYQQNYFDVNGVVLEIVYLVKFLFDVEAIFG